MNATIAAIGIGAKALAATTFFLALGGAAYSVAGVDQPQEVAFNVEPAGSAFDQVDTTALATTYARDHGLTSCGQPADAELDDTFLTLASDLDGNPTTDKVEPVDLDTALDSAGKRLVLLACDKAGE